MNVIKQLWARFTYSTSVDYRLRRTVAWHVPENFHKCESEPYENGVTVQELRDFLSYLVDTGKGDLVLQVYDGRNDEYDIVTALKVDEDNKTLKPSITAYKVEKEDEWYVPEKKE